MKTTTLRIGLYAACFAALAIVAEFVFELREATLESDRLRLEDESEALALNYQRRVNQIFDSLSSVAAFLESSEDVTAAEFERFIARSNILKTAGRPRAIAVMPLLTSDDVPLFERQMAARAEARAALGYTPFRLETSDDRYVYAPVTLAETVGSRDGILSYDLATSDERLSAAEASLISGKAKMTRPVRLSQDDENSPASVLILTVIRNAAGNASDTVPLAGRDLIIGAGFTPALAIEDLLDRQEKMPDTRFTLSDTTDETPIPLIRSFEPRPGEAPVVIENLLLGERIWTFEFFHGDAADAGLGADRIVLLGIAGMTLIIALTVALDRLLSNSVRLERTVDERTQELQESNTALSQAVQRAHAENEAKSNFLARMSHDLRTPLNAVIGYAQFISNEMYGRIDERRYIEYAKTIEEAGRVQLELVEEILTLTALQSGARVFDDAPFDLGETVRQSADIVRLRARQKGVDLTAASTLDDRQATGDQASIQQILLNLLTNAIKFTPSGGMVTVAAEPYGTDGFAIRVTDTGVGIAPKDLETIMQPFSKLRPNAYTTDEGVGLGLTIVKTLAEANGGEVKIDSQLGVGTDVAVLFTKTPAAATSAAD